MPNVIINDVAIDNNSEVNGVYVGMDVGVFYRDDTLADWVPFYNDLPNVEVSEMEIDYKTNEIVAATFGRGVWKSSLYGKSCEDNIDISNDLDGFKYYTANNIVSSALVEPLSEVTLVAKTSIELVPGFETSDEMTFEGALDPFVCLEGIQRRKVQGLMVFLKGL